jgi:hypothetical protein
LAPSGRSSSEFSRVWRELEQLREAKGFDVATVAKKNGFVRSTWFNYKKTGAMPFSLLERVAGFLGARVEVAVITQVSEARATPQEHSAGESVPDYLKRLSLLLEKLPEDERAFAAGVAYNAIRELQTHPPEADAGDERASRGRK